ncbi:MFS transporter [Lacticaseibacillus paracasei]|uniref:MFS transporter n=1 Tax=Lacticaseibacillus paracasei TaxID=1597 RepID=UPI000A1DC5C6|nr:MFS transporter [Lacticaseibacillus paracasei]OSP84434.1 MFS transporter [Lacticaseibacillus paracasei]
MFRKSNYAWWIFAGTCLISLVGFGLIINTVGLFYGPISVAFHVGRAEVALMSSFQNIAAAIVLLFAGKIMAKVSVKWVLVVCFAVIGVGLASLSSANSMIHFYVVWTLIGICQPFAIILSIPVLLGNWFQKKLGTVMGIALGISAVGGTLFNPLISSVITNSGWRTGLLVEGLIVLITMVPTALFILKDKPSGSQKAYGFDPNSTALDQEKSLTGLTLKESLKTPMFYLIAFAMVALQFVAGFVQHISAHIVNIGMPLTIGATVVSGVMMGAAVGKITIGYLLDKFNNGLVIVIYTLFGIIGWSGLQIMHSSPLLVGSGFILGLGQGVLLVALPFFTRTQFGLKDYSNILSVISMFGAVSSAAAVSIDGMFFDISKSYAIPLTLNVFLYIFSGIAVVISISIAKKVVVKLGGSQHAE